MNTFAFGTSALNVSPLCFGCAGLGTSVHGSDATALVTAYLEAGGNFLDTAHCYAFWERNGHGASERDVGRIIRELNCREQVVIATKGGHPDGGEAYRRPEQFLAPNVLQDDIACSLYRLGVDTIDLYYLHRDDGKTPVGEIIGTLNGEIDAGRLRFIAASNWSVERMTEANRWAETNGKAGFVAAQVQMSLAKCNVETGQDPTWRGVEPDQAHFYEETKMPVAAFSATANGYFAHRSGADTLFDNATSRARRTRAETLALEIGVTATQVALAHLVHQDFTVVPVFSTTKREHLQEAVEAMGVSLTPEQVRWLRDG